MQDLDLIDRIVNGDEAAIAHLLIDRCGDKLKYLSLYRFGTLGMEVPEVVSELYLILHKNEWKALKDFRGSNNTGKSCSLEGYISLIASRLLWKKMGKAVKEKNWLAALMDEESDEVRKAPDLNWDPAHLKTDLIELIQLLDKPKERMVLMKYKVEGDSVENVAAALQISQANVYTLCNRAIHSLKILLDNEEVRCG